MNNTFKGQRRIPIKLRHNFTKLFKIGLINVKLGQNNQTLEWKQNQTSQILLLTVVHGKGCMEIN